MFVMYRSPGSAAKWLLGIPKKTPLSKAPAEVQTLKRRLQEDCAAFEIEHRRSFLNGRTYYKISEPAAKDWFEKRYQVQEAICGYSG